MYKRTSILLLFVPLIVAAGQSDTTQIRREPAEVLRPAASEAARTAPVKPEAQRPEDQPAQGPAESLKASPAADLKMKMMRPDLVVEVANPGSGTLPVVLTVRNVGVAATPAAFTVVTSAEAWCEVGKMKSPAKVNSQDGEQTVAPIPPGSFRYVFVRPPAPHASSSNQTPHWSGGGCYLRFEARADTWGMIAETNENNNTGYAHYCPGSECY